MRRGKHQSQPLAQRFWHPALYEVMRIIPLTIRISHYTRAPAAWPGRPTIHVVGEWHTATPPALTRVRGTVEMTASGDVRWTLVRDRLSLVPMRVADCTGRHPLARTEMANGPVRAYSSADAALLWASLGCGPVRTMSLLTLSVRSTLSHPLLVLQCALMILSFWVVGPFWAWKVGPATAVVTPNTNC